MALLMQAKVGARSQARFALGLGVALVVLALGGCASTMTTNVTRFNQWPANTQGATYAIVPATLDLQDASTAAQPIGSPQTLILPELEARTYAADLENKLQAQGMVPANNPAQARMQASYSVQARSAVLESREPVFRPALRLGMGFGGRRGWGGASFGFPFGWGDDYGGWRERVVMQPVQHYRLRVHIADRGQAGKTQAAAPTVFDGSADYMGSPAALNTVMPYLMRAVFDGFPGANGQTQQVVFDTQNGQRLSAK